MTTQQSQDAFDLPEYPSTTEQTIDTKFTVLKINESGAIQTHANLPEDEFVSFFEADSSSVGSSFIKPPHDLRLLEQLQFENNTLSQCITTMEVNIDGSGYSFIQADEDTPMDPSEVKAARQFFDEVFPGKSFQTIRRALRRDMEATGNGYLEVIRNVSGDVVFLNHVDAKSIRLIKLDDGATVDKTISRNGATVSVTMHIRERRYIQKIGNKVVYFKDFNASRDLNKLNGLWEGTNEQPIVEAKDRATELIHFTINRDVLTPYGLPRWINQVPSVLGSRKAEEQNLFFFNTGGIPPALILIQGGSMTPDAKAQIMAYMSGKGANKHNVAVAELYSTGGSLNSAGQVKVTVERFGSEVVKDSMFENYDTRSEERVRGAFRLPPIFVGKASDFSFATAFASYVTAETQVFAPERREFDEVVNLMLMPQLGFKTIKYMSRAVSIKESKIELEAIKIARDSGVLSEEGIISSLNRATNLELRVASEDEKRVQPPTRNGEQQGGANPREIGAATPEENAPLENNRGQSATKVDTSQLDYYDLEPQYTE